MTALPEIPLLQSGGRLREIPITAIRAAQRNPRTDAEATVDGLAASLSTGLVNFPTVVAISDDEYELVDGERRWRGAQVAGLPTLTCFVREQGTPSATLFTQILANLHRQELGPLDESAALKAAWLLLNAQAIGQGEQADLILGAAKQLRDALEPLRELLEMSGWNWREPQVSQAVFVEMLGLGMSAAVLKKKLQVLSATEAIQGTARTHKLTAAAIRALMTLEPEQQTTLLAAIEREPELAKAVRSVVQGVKQKGRTVEEAISIVSGRSEESEEPPAPSPLAGASKAVQAMAQACNLGIEEQRALAVLAPEEQERLLWAIKDTPELAEAVLPIVHEVQQGQAIEEAISAMAARSAEEVAQAKAAAAPVVARPTISTDAAMEAVMPLIDLAQELQNKLDQLQRVLGGDGSLDALPQPWGGYATEAIRLITTTIQPYSS